MNGNSTSDLGSAIICRLDNIIALLRALVDKSGCQPCDNSNTDSAISRPSVGTSSTKILSNDAQRLGFTISNPSTTDSLLIGPTPDKLTSTLGSAKIGPGETQQFNAYNFPSTLNKEWYAVSTGGAVVPQVTNERSLIGAK